MFLFFKKKQKTTNPGKEPGPACGHASDTRQDVAHPFGRKRGLSHAQLIDWHGLAKSGKTKSRVALGNWEVCPPSSGSGWRAGS